LHFAALRHEASDSGLIGDKKNKNKKSFLGKTSRHISCKILGPTTDPLSTAITVYLGIHLLEIEEATQEVVCLKKGRMFFSANLCPM
jgi:hypothetical protein